MSDPHRKLSQILETVFFFRNEKCLIVIEIVQLLRYFWDSPGNWR